MARSWPTSKPEGGWPEDPATAYALSVREGETIAGPHVRDACARHLDDLLHGPDRGLEWKPGKAAHVVGYFQTVLKLAGGEFEGEEFDPLPWQKFILGSLFGWYGEDGYRRFRTAFVETGKGPLALDTPIPTPDGWTTMGEIEVGDMVIADDGKPCRVVDASPVFHGRDCYRVVFDDGEEIVADAEHRWLTEARWSGHNDHGGGKIKRGVPRNQFGDWRHAVRTTEEIRETVRYKNGDYMSANHSIHLGGALELPEADLPIDPYVLGVWLGDGDSDCARITVADKDAELLEHVGACGVDVGDRQGSKLRAGRYLIGSVGVRGPGGSGSLNARLREEELLGDKRVPAEYLRGSVDQRQALLQGLMDTDGYISKRGNCEFTTTRRELGEAAKELVASLGMKVTMNEGRATIGGRDVGPKFRVLFHPPHDFPVFRLERKLARQKKRHSRRSLSGERRIVDVEPVDSVPVRCITIDAKSHLFLAGRGMIPTHNSGKSPLAAGIGMYMLTADDEARAEIYAAATKKDQAMVLFRDAVAMVDQSPALNARIKQSGNNPVWNLAYTDTGSFFRPISSDSGQSGPRPHCALLDEIHEHKDDEMVEMMRAGTKGRREALIFMITNSGFDRTSVCYDRHEYGTKIAAGELQDDGFFAYICSLEEDEDPLSDPDDPELGYPRSWARANPSLQAPEGRRTFQPKYLREQVREAKGMPAKESTVRRLNFCEWVDAESPWISGNLWRACEVDALEGVDDRPSYLALDLSGKRDLTALAQVWPDGAGGFDARVRFWTPGDTLAHRSRVDRVPYDIWEKDGLVEAPPGKSIDYGYVAQEVAELWGKGEVEALAFDPYRMEDFQRELDRLGVPNWIYEGPDGPTHDGLMLIRHGQGFGGGKSDTTLWMPRSITILEDAILHAELRVEKNPCLTWNAASAVLTQDAQENRKWEKRKSTGRIDGIVALSMAVGAAEGADVETAEPTISFI